MITCARCNYETNLVGNLRTHLNRVHKCQDINECGKTCEELLTLITKDTSEFHYKCEKCGRKFKTRQSKYSHKRNCGSLEAELILAKEQIAQLSEKLDNICKKLSNKQNTAINLFGKENLDYIDASFIHKCIKRLRTDGVYELCKKIYFDPEHSENHTIKIKAIRNSSVEIMQENGWEIRNFKAVIPIIINKIFKILNDNFAACDHGPFDSALLKEEIDDIINAKKLAIYELCQTTSKGYREASRAIISLVCWKKM